MMPIRLVCFPGAGRTAGLYARWAAQLPDRIELAPIELPGRGARSGEAPIGHMPELVARVLPEVVALADRPLAIFGHSLGAKLGFELARELVARGRAPVQLFVAASPHDRFPAWGRSLHSGPREDLLAEMRRLGTPSSVLDDPALVELLLPMVRADFQLANEYSVAPGPPLACAITAFAGRHDPDITVADVAGWERHTSGRFRLVVVDAGHDFVREPAGEVIRELVRAFEETREDRS